MKWTKAEFINEKFAVLNNEEESFENLSMALNL